MRRRWEPLITALLVVGSLFVFVKLALYIDRPLVDDAAISIGYARSLVDGDGFRPTPYSQISEGFSNPTWTVLLGILEAAHINSMRTARPMGLVFATLGLALLSLWGPISQKRRIQLEDAAAPLFACTNASLAYWSIGGLEMGLLTFLLALFGVLLFLPTRSRKVAIGLGLTAAALSLTRPEGALYAAAVAIPWLVHAAITRSLSRRYHGIALATALAIVLGYVIFRRVYFGAYLPNTYYAKKFWTFDLPPAHAASIREQVRQYIEGFITTVKLLLVVGACGTVLSLLGGLRVAKTAIGSALIVLAMIYFTWRSDADWMRQWRFLTPMVPFLCYPIGAGITGLRKLFERRWVARRRPLRVAAHGLVALGALVLLYESTKTHQSRWAEVKAGGGDTPLDPDKRYSYGSEVRDIVAPYHMIHPLLAGPDMGWLMMGLRDFEIIDLAGLADVAVARHYTNQKALRDYLTKEGLPSLLMVWGPSIWLSNMPDILSQYEANRNSSYRRYTKMTPTSDDRCPEGKSQALADTAEVMSQKILTDLRAGDAVRALALWRCYLTYRADSELPSVHQRVAIAREAQSSAEAERQNGRIEPALRAYSLCAVIGSSSWAPSSSCRMRAEVLRAQLFPRESRAPRRR